MLRLTEAFNNKTTRKLFTMFLFLNTVDYTLTVGAFGYCPACFKEYNIVINALGILSPATALYKLVIVPMIVLFTLILTKDLAMRAYKRAVMKGNLRVANIALRCPLIIMSCLVLALAIAIGINISSILQVMIND